MKNIFGDEVLDEDPAQAPATNVFGDPIIEDEVASTQPDVLSGKAPSFNYEKLIDVFQKNGIYGSASAAAGTDAQIWRDQDLGEWSLPSMVRDDANLLERAGTMVKQKLGSRGSNAYAAEEGSGEMQGIFDDFQAANGLTDAEVSDAWNDFVKVTKPMDEDEEGRVLSNGAFQPNIMNKAFRSEESALAAIRNSNASPAFKMAVAEKIPEIVKSITQAKLEAYTASAIDATQVVDPKYWAITHNRLGDFGSPEFMADYEKDQVDDVNAVTKFLRGASASLTKGNINLAQQIAGAAGFATGLDSAGESSADMTRAAALIDMGSPDIGMTGALLEQAAPLAAQMAITKGIGGVASMATESAALVSSVATLGSLVTAGLQSAGGQMGQSIEAGEDESTARAKAFKAGVSTAVITGIFEKIGGGKFGGVERVAQGKAASEITVGDLLASAATGKDFGKALWEFSSDVLKAAGGEAAEESIDQMTQALLTADPNTNLADAWDQAEQAGLIGGFVGGLVDLGSKSFHDTARTEVASSVNQAAQQAASAGLPQTASALGKPLSFTPANPIAAPAPSPGVLKVRAGKADQDVGVDETTGAGLAEKLLGSSPEGKQYSPDMDPKKFDLTPIPGSDLMAVRYEGLHTDRAYDPKTGASVELPAAVEPSLRASQEGILRSPDHFLVKQEPEVASTQASGDQAPAAKVTKLPAEPADDIDLSPPAPKTPKTPETPSASIPGETPAPAAPVAVAPVESGAKNDQSSLPAVEQFKQVRSQSGVLPDSGKLEASVSALDSSVGVDIQNDSPTRYSPTTGRVSVNAATATPAELNAASVQASADRTGVDASALFESADDEVREDLEASHPDATPAQLGRLLVAAAVNGNQSARASLASSGNSRLVNEVVIKMKGDDHVARSIARWNASPMAASIPDSVKTAETGTFSAPKADLDKALQTTKSKQGSSEHVDSGPSNGLYPTLSAPLPLGSVVTSTDSAGNPLEQRRVMWTEAIPGGGVRHHLSRVDTSSDKTVKPVIRKFYAPNQRVLTAARGLAASLKSALTQDSSVLAPQDRQTLLKVTRDIVRAQLSEIASEAFADSRLVFGSNLPGVMMFQHSVDGQSRIHVSEDTLLDQFVQRVNGIPLENEIALEGAAQDYAQFLAQTVFHELKHELLEQHTDRGQRIEGMREMADLARVPGHIRDVLLANARTQLQYGFVADSSLAQLSDEELVTVLNGGDSRLDDAALDSLLDTLAHEILVDLSEKMETGTTYAETLQSLSNWTQRFVAPDATPKQLTRLQSLMNRLMEMANRLAAAVSNFYAAHRLAAQLPPSLYDASLALQAAMEAGGFRAPDLHGIQKKAIAEANDRMGQVAQAASNFREKDLVDAQRALRAAARGDSSSVSIDPLTGLLRTPRKELQPLVDRVNAAGNADTLLRGSAMARDLSNVLKHLNAGRAIGPSSKVVDTFDPERVERNSGFIRESVRRGVAQAAGMEASVLVSRINAAQSERFMALHEPIPGLQPLSEMFTTGPLSSLGVARKAAEDLARVETEQLQARLDHLTHASPKNWERLKAADQALFNARSALTQQVDQILARATDPSDPLHDAALLLRETVETNRLATRRALESFERNRLLTRPITSIDDAMMFNALHPDEMDMILMSAGLGDGRVKGALVEGYETIEALGRLRNFPAQLEYLAMGGVRPESISRPDVSGWRNVNARLEGSLSLMPLNLGRALRPTAPDNTLDAMKGVVDKAFNDPSFSGFMDVGSVTFSFPESAATASLDPDLARAFLVGDSVTLMTFNGALDASSALYEPLLENMASEVRAAARQSSALLGLDPSAPLPITGWDLSERLTENVRALNTPLVAALENEHWRFGAAVTREVMATGGFSEVKELMENGSERIRFGDRAIRLPDTSALSDRGFQSLVSSGAIGDLVASTHNFASSMEADNITGMTQPLLSHDQGLTPAGLAYQLVSPKLMEWAALTKGLVVDGVRIDEAIIAASSDPELTAEFYNNLAPGFENRRAFLVEREKLSANPYGLVGRFWDLHKAARAANTIHEDTLNLLHDKVRARGATGTSDESRIPISLDAMSDIGFQQNLRRQVVPDPAKLKTPSTTLVSLFVPASAQSLMDEMLSAMQETADLLGKRLADGRPAFLQSANEDPRNKDGRKDPAEITEFEQENALREAERARDRMDRARYTALAALFGGNQEAIMGFVHEFSSVVTDERGEKVLSYHVDRLNAAIMDELSRLRAEEIERGVVLDWDGNVFDAAIKDLRVNNPEHAAVFDSLLESGGQVSRVFDPGLASPAQAPGFDATAGSVLSALGGRIPGMTTITGNASWQGQADGNRPTVVFVADANSPTLVFPYGGRAAPDEAHARKAVRDMIAWMGSHGGVDIVAEAGKVLAPVRARGNDLMSSRLKSEFRGQLEQILTDGNNTLNEASDALIDAYAGAWTEIINSGADQALANVAEPAAFLFDRNGSPEVTTPAQAAEVLALALTQPQLKKVLLLSMAEDPELPYPLPWAVAEHGNLASTGNIPGALDHFQAAQIQALPAGVALTNEFGRVVELGDEDFIAEAQREAFKGLGAIFENAGISQRQATEMGASPLMHQQMQWLNNLLYDVMGHLVSSTTPPGLAGLGPAGRGLTLMEARQLLATLDPQVIQDALRASGGGTTSWNQPGRDNGLSAQAMLRITGELADDLRRRYNEWSVLDGDNLISSSEFVQRQVRNIGTYSLIDTLRSGGDDTWHQTRIRKGMVRYAQMYGAEMVQSQDSSLWVGTLDADPRALERRAIADGFVQYVDAPDGRGGVERVTVHEAEIREFNRQKENNAAMLAEVQRKAIARGAELESAMAALSAFREASDNLLGASDADSFLAHLNDAVDVSSSAEEVNGVVRAFFKGRRELVEGMASSILRDYQEFQGDIARSVGLGQVANGRSAMEFALTQASIEHKAPLSTLANQVIEGHRTLERMEADLNPEGRLSGEGVPHWYQDLPSETRQRLLSVRREINRAAEDHNIRVAQASFVMNDKVPGMVSEQAMMLPYAATGSRRAPRLTLRREEMVARSAAMQSLLSDVRNPQALATRVREAAIRHAVNRSEWFNPSDGISSIDLSNLAFGDTRIAIPAAAIPDLEAALAGPDKLQSVADVLNRHVFTREDLMNDAKVVAEQAISKAVTEADESFRTRSAEALVLRATRGVAELANIDSLTATRLVLDAIERVARGEVASTQLAVESALRFQAETEAALAAHTRSVGASKTNPNDPLKTAPMVVHLTGSPDNIEIARRILARESELWSRLQQAQIGRSEFRDGWTDARLADLAADELVTMGAAALSSATRSDYRVTGDLLTPEDFPSRVKALLTQKNGKEPSKAEVTAKAKEMRRAAVIPSPPSGKQVQHPRVFSLMNKLHGAGMFRPAKHLAKAAQGVEAKLGEFGAINTMVAFHEDMLALLVSELDAGTLKGKGATNTAGVMGPDLDSQVRQALSLLGSNPDDSNVANVFNVYSEVVAFMTTDRYLDDLVGGLVGTKALTHWVLKGLMHHNSKLRLTFARNLIGQQAARRVLAIFEHGPNGRLGRNRFKGMLDAYSELFHDQIREMSGSRAERLGQEFTGRNERLENTSTGWMFASIKAQLQNGFGSDQERAKTLEKMFTQADDGLLVALTQKIGSGNPGQKAVDQVREWALEDSWRLLEERELYRKQRDFFLPILNKVSNGSITADEGILLMHSSMHKDAVGYARFLEDAFASVSAGMGAALRLMGGDVASTQNRPVVPFRWNTFNRDLKESRDIPTTGEGMAIERGRWFRPPNRIYSGREINLLNVNGSTAPLDVISDMIYRMNVAPSFHIASAITGEGARGDQGTSATYGLSYREGITGMIRREAEARFGTGNATRQADDSSIAVALTIQEMAQKDMSGLAPSNRLMRGVHEFSMLGVLRALNSLSQVWRQSLPPLATYIAARGPMKENIGVAAPYLLYNLNKVAGVPMRVMDKLAGRPASPGLPYAEQVDAFVKRYAPYISARSPGGNEHFLNEVGADRLPVALTARGRLTGGASKAVSAATLIPSVVHAKAVRAGSWMLSKMIGSAEKSVVRPIFMNEVLKGLNRELAAQGFPPVTMNRLLRDSSIHVPPGVLQDAGVIVDDMFGPSDASKKGDVFRPTDSVFTEVLRQLATTFANHQVSLASNTYAANAMLKESDDPATRAEARRIITTNIAQNVAFQLFRWSMIALILAQVGSGGDERRREEIQKRLFGLMDGPDARDGKLMHWLSLSLGGEDTPLGYDKRSGHFTKDEMQNDAKLAIQRSIKEFLMQTPWGGTGMVFSTAAGSAVLEALMKRSIMEAIPGDLKQYERAGFVRPESLGGDGQGPRSQSDFSRFLYGASSTFVNDMEGRGVFLNGLGAVVDPVVLLSNAGRDLDSTDFIQAFGAQAPFLPREARKKVEEDVKEDTGARIWHNQWKRR